MDNAVHTADTQPIKCQSTNSYTTLVLHLSVFSHGNEARTVKWGGGRKIINVFSIERQTHYIISHTTFIAERRYILLHCILHTFILHTNFLVHAAFYYILLFVINNFCHIVMLLYIISYFKLNTSLCHLLFYITYSHCRDISLGEQKKKSKIC